MVLAVNPSGTSQTCTCGAPVPKTLSQRWHECLACGLSLARDHVSALLIQGLGRGTCVVNVCRWAPCWHRSRLIYGAESSRVPGMFMHLEGGSPSANLMEVASRTDLEG